MAALMIAAGPSFYKLGNRLGNRTLWQVETGPITIVREGPCGCDKISRVVSRFFGWRVGATK